MCDSHKEKERLRHQKQVKLLNKVMEYIPKTANEPKTKVRQLRRLVLYTHYLRILHSKLTGEELCTHSIVGEKNCVENTSVKPVSKPAKKQTQTKRKSRAHIVFLHADKSANQMNNALKNCTLNNTDAETHSDDQELSNVSSLNYEYKVPETVPIDSKVSMYCDQEGAFISDELHQVQLINDFPISHSCEVSSELIGNDEKSYSELVSYLSSKNAFYKGKENYQPVVVDNTAIYSKGREFVEYSLYDDRFIQSIAMSEENLRASKYGLDNFNTYLENDCNNRILKDLEFTTVKNKDFAISQLSNLGEDKEYLLNSNGSSSLHNVASDYNFHSLPTKHYQNSVSCCDNSCSPAFSLNSAPRQPVYCDQFSMTGNASDCSSSSTLTDKINIDGENLSDSNPSCNLSDSSNSSQYNFRGYYTNSFCSGPKLSENHDYFIDEAMKYEPTEIFPDSLFQSNYNYSGSNNVLVNEALLRQIYDTTLPYFGSVYPSINFSRNTSCPIAFQPDSGHALRSKTAESKALTDYDSLYSPSLCASIHSEEFSLSHPKVEVTNFSCSSEPFSNESIRPRIEEEISYPLAQFLGSCS